MLQAFFTLVLLSFSLVSSHVQGISIHAPVLNQMQQESTGGESSSQGQAQQPPMKISTGRMKAISTPVSPRCTNCLRDIHHAFGHEVKGVSHVAVLPDPKSAYEFPKVSVTPGKQDSNVFSTFHHPRTYPKGGAPFQYMNHQQFDQLTDVHQPGKVYRIGQQKAKKDSEIVNHASNILAGLTDNKYNRHPKAALAHSLPGDARATTKRPTINVSPGRLYGNMITFVYGSKTQMNDKGKSNKRERSPRTEGGESSKRSRVH